MFIDLDAKLVYDMPTSLYLRRILCSNSPQAHRIGCNYSIF